MTPHLVMQWAFAAVILAITSCIWMLVITLGVWLWRISLEKGSET